MNESAKLEPDPARNREEGRAFNPKFGADGLVLALRSMPCAASVLMVAHMNEAALRATLSTGIVHYWSRSRGALWRKGDTSGQTQTLIEMRVDCDQDAFLAFVRVAGDGGACHTGRRSCFYRRVEMDGETAAARIHRTVETAEPMAQGQKLRDHAGLNNFTLIVWRHLGGKLKFPSGRRAVGSFSSEFGNVQSGLSQNRY